MINIYDEDENIAREISANLIEQLLSTEAQKKVENNFESAYYDHLRWLKAGKSINMGTINSFQPLVLQDLEELLKSKDQVSVVFEALLRYYDLLDFVEMKISEQTKLKLSGYKQAKALLKQIGLSKQKIIFYLSFLKSNGQDNVPLWQPEQFGCSEFIKFYVNDNMFKRLNATELKKKQDAYVKFRKDTTETGQSVNMTDLIKEVHETLEDRKEEDDDEFEQTENDEQNENHETIYIDDDE